MFLRLILLAASAALLSAQMKTLHVDPAAGSVHWALGGTLHTTHGTFRMKSGLVRFDPSNGKAGGEIIVDARSGESGNGSRDGRMHKAVLESGKFPDIRFSPSHFDGTLKPEGTSQITLYGSFEIHGVTHEMKLPVDVKMDGKKLEAQLKFEIPYVDWGLKDPSTFVLKVDKQVELTVDLIGVESN